MRIGGKFKSPNPSLSLITCLDRSSVLSLQKNNIEFVIKPYIRFQGQPGEQATMFFYDPNGLALEFKSFKNDAMIFAK